MSRTTASNDPLVFHATKMASGIPRAVAGKRMKYETVSARRSRGLERGDLTTTLRGLTGESQGDWRSFEHLNEDI